MVELTGHKGNHYQVHRIFSLVGSLKAIGLANFTEHMTFWKL